MPRDAQSETSVILPDLLSLTGNAVAPAQALLDAAKAHLRVELSENGRISAALIEQNQTALQCEHLKSSRRIQVYEKPT